MATHQRDVAARLDPHGRANPLRLKTGDGTRRDLGAVISGDIAQSDKIQVSVRSPCCDLLFGAGESLAWKAYLPDPWEKAKV
jgi:hypothetical protein